MSMNDVAEIVDLADMRDQYLQQQLRGDRRAALHFIEAALEGGATVDEVRCRIVQAAQREIGLMWQEDRITIAQEHMATAISQLALAHLFQRSEFRGRINKKIMVACVPGEHHEFPARLLADSLEVEGYDVRFLGADVPLDSLIHSIEAESPDVIALSMTMLFHLPALREAVAAVRALNKPGLLVAIGGSLFESSPSLAADVTADLIATNAESFISQLAQKLGTPA
jgi:MerR family transcriptional regulator, light-induced transcriptional regulator